MNDSGLSQGNRQAVPPIHMPAFSSSFQRRLHLTLVTPCLGLGLLCQIGCSTPRTTEQMRIKTLQAVMDQQHQVAVGTLNELYDSHFSEEPIDTDGSVGGPDTVNEKQALLWHMERGLVDHLFGNILLSNRHLDRAGELVDERRTKTLVTEVGTFAANDTIRDFPGSAFEHTQVDYYRALNRLLQAAQREGLYQPSQMIVAPPPKDGSTPPPPPFALHATDSISAADNYDRAINLTRRMTINQLQETKDAADGNRYDDDPFARFLAAAVTYTPKIQDRAVANLQFADVMLKQAMEGYSKQATVLGGKQPFRYEVTRRPDTVERLYIRHCQSFDPSGFEKTLTNYGISENDPRIKSAKLASGYGSVLVLNHVGYITHPEVLDIRVVAAQASRTFQPTPAQKARGHTATQFKIGLTAFWATGPGSDVVKTWGVVPIPGDAVQKLVAPGGAAFMGFAIPVHDVDVPILPPGSVRAIPADGGNTYQQPLEVLTDLDAYARATLKDDQPGVLAKTMLRAIGKQAAAGVASRVVDKESDRLGSAGKLVSMGFNLLSSTAATLSEIADTRSWTTLPDHINGTLLDLLVGKYALIIDTATGPVECGGVTVEPGRIVVVPIRTFPEPLRYRTAN